LGWKSFSAQTLSNVNVSAFLFARCSRFGYKQYLVRLNPVQHFYLEVSLCLPLRAVFTSV
jgi:hypothetical protein